MNIQNVHLLLMTSTALNIYILSSHFAFENVGRRLSKVSINSIRSANIDFRHI